MATILVFDSGVGGLSVLRAIQAHAEIRVDQHQWVFCSDNAYFPYGTKTEAVLVQRVCDVLETLYQRFKPDIVVIACNTASTIALDAVRQRLPCEIVGVVPAIKPAALLSRSKSIGLLATPGTIARRYTHQLIENFASHCQVTSVGSSELVQMAESYLRSGQIDWEALTTIVQPFQDAYRDTQLDTIVLACTHFPLVSEALKQVLPQITYWVDSGDAIARRVFSLLQTAVTSRTDEGENYALYTRNTDIASDTYVDVVDTTLIQLFSDFGLNRFDYVDI